jgi:hypothetical protein
MTAALEHLNQTLGLTPIVDPDDIVGTFLQAGAGMARYPSWSTTWRTPQPAAVPVRHTARVEPSSSPTQWGAGPARDGPTVGSRRWSGSGLAVQFGGLGAAL